MTGASGGVGRFAIQLAHLGGADVTALASSSAARVAGLRELGADQVVSDVAQLRSRFDLILELVGGDTRLGGRAGAGAPARRLRAPGLHRAGATGASRAGQ